MVWVFAGRGHSSRPLQLGTCLRLSLFSLSILFVYVLAQVVVLVVALLLGPQVQFRSFFVSSCQSARWLLVVHMACRIWHSLSVAILLLSALPSIGAHCGWPLFILSNSIRYGVFQCGRQLLSLTQLGTYISFRPMAFLMSGDCGGCCWLDPGFRLCRSYRSLRARIWMPSPASIAHVTS